MIIKASHRTFKLTNPNLGSMQDESNPVSGFLVSNSLSHAGSAEFGTQSSTCPKIPVWGFVPTYQFELLYRILWYLVQQNSNPACLIRRRYGSAYANEGSFLLPMVQLATTLINGS